MENTKRILIIEDDLDICLIEETYLQAAMYQTTTLHNGLNIEALLQKEHFDLVLLDIMLPGIDGYELCKIIRRLSDIPIIMVTAKNQTIDKITGLNLGSDDFIAKPFDPAELVARVNANIRQYNRLKKGQDEERIQVGQLTILTKNWRVFKNNQELKLPHREFELLRFLALNPNIVFSKEELFEKIWGYDYVGDSATVTVHINRLREKIEENSKDPKILETIWGVGYRLNNHIIV